MTFRDELSKQIKFTVCGLSLVRMAYLLVLISVLLLPLHSFADWQGDEYISDVATGLMIGSFALGFLARQNDRNNFVPALLSFLVLFCHLLLQKL